MLPNDLCNTNHTIPSLLAPARPDPLTTNELVNELRPVSRLRPQIQSTQKNSFSCFLSSRIAFGSRQLRDRRSRGSVSGAGPPLGVMRQQNRHFISFHYPDDRQNNHVMLEDKFREAKKE